MMTDDSKVVDPVCGMTIAKNCCTVREHEGQTYYLCSELCVVRFDEDAAAYVAVSRLGLQGWGQTPMPGFLMPPDGETNGEEAR